MNDDSPASVDVSVAFFASVLVLFVFVTFALHRETPRTDRISTGQTVATTTAISPSWSPIPERTSYAFLSGKQLQVLEMNHFSAAMDAPEKMVSTDAHYENIMVLSNYDAPEAFALDLGTLGGSLPHEWVRTSVRAVPSKNDGCPIDDQTMKAFRRRLLSVLVMRTKAVDLPGFVAFADVCNLRYRLIPLPAAGKTGRVSFRISLQPGSFRFQTIFR